MSYKKSYFNLSLFRPFPVVKGERKSILDCILSHCSFALKFETIKTLVDAFPFSDDSLWRPKIIQYLLIKSLLKQHSFLVIKYLEYILGVSTLFDPHDIILLASQMKVHRMCRTHSKVMSTHSVHRFRDKACCSNIKLPCDEPMDVLSRSEFDELCRIHLGLLLFRKASIEVLEREGIDKALNFVKEYLYNFCDIPLTTFVVSHFISLIVQCDSDFDLKQIEFSPENFDKILLRTVDFLYDRVDNDAIEKKMDEMSDKDAKLSYERTIQCDSDFDLKQIEFSPENFDKILLRTVDFLYDRVDNDAIEKKMDEMSDKDAKLSYERTSPCVAISPCPLLSECNLEKYFRHNFSSIQRLTPRSYQFDRKEEVNPSSLSKSIVHDSSPSTSSCSSIPSAPSPLNLDKEMSTCSKKEGNPLKSALLSILKHYSLLSHLLFSAQLQMQFDDIMYLDDVTLIVEGTKIPLNLGNARFLRHTVITRSGIRMWRKESEKGEDEKHS
ncbi:hypothetical protein ADUPG1_007118 [Aduncisulcus paluster]|uniref:Uncharacterized protein n=1 Tax=Aduncisulcus paluster TaxID=2918883 RepID=A0ABQ5KKT6_9EUKA|nr:hypothetical protein ADUPG1_007118 [Aduncisulcus paluster]